MPKIQNAQSSFLTEPFGVNIVEICVHLSDTRHATGSVRGAQTSCARSGELSLQVRAVVYKLKKKNYI